MDDHETQRTRREPVGWVWWIGLTGVLVWLGLTAAQAGADSIELRRSATTSSSTITLGDVARLDGEAADALAGVTLLQMPAGAERVTLDAAEVRATLDEHDVHWGRLSLRGYTRCEVTRTIEQPVVGLEPDTEGSAGPVTPVHLMATTAEQTTARDALMALLHERAGDPDGLQIELLRSDDARLDRPVAADRLTVEPQTTGSLGRVPVRVSWLDEHGRADETLLVSATVRRTVQAVVATQTITRGRLIEAAAVELREVTLERDGRETIGDASLVVGQLAATQLRPGATVLAEHVQAPRLVRRGELVAVRAVVGGLQVSTQARAAEDGGLDEVIQLRDERTRRSFAAVVTGVRAAQAVGD